MSYAHICSLKTDRLPLALQHPSAVRVKEEIARLSKRLKPAEKELEAERKRCTEQQATIKRLQGDLSKIVAGQLPFMMQHLFLGFSILTAGEEWNEGEAL